MKIDVYCLNSFTYQNTGGNPAGVVLNVNNLTAALSTQQMQAIARKVGFSETAFVNRDDVCDFNVRFFTPTDEVDFCGHATLAVFSLMYQQKFITAKTYSQQTKAGRLNVTIGADGFVTMEQSLPNFIGEVVSAEVANLLDIDQALFLTTNLPCEIISTGLADLIIPIPFGLLDNIIPEHKQIAHFSQKYNVVGLHLFELSNKESEFTASCRNFAPLFGINEESATGSACGALACYLAKHNIVNGNQKGEFYHSTFEQGRVMGCHSKLSTKVTIKAEIINKVEVGGFAILNKIIQFAW
jgi:PhzF family phenazine biosynthesis protein